MDRPTPAAGNSATREELPFSAAAERNAAPILAVLQSWLPAGARVLELASGSGQHAAHFAAAGAAWCWQPSDADARMLPAIAARCAGLAAVAAPRRLDLLDPAWTAGLAPVDALYCANLLHISPWPVCGALMRGAAGLLAEGGSLCVYGPFKVEGEPLAASNAAFDEDLRARNPAWGLRWLGQVDELAAAAGLRLQQRVDMPARNLLLRWVRASA
jgi:SAM-dependent methyltransferase